MAERTKRGDKDREHEDEEMTTGQPVEDAKEDAAAQGGVQGTNTTKDKGRPPASGKQRGADKKS